MTDVIDQGPRSQTSVKLDGKRLFVHTLVHDDPILEANRRIANERVLERAKMPLHENEDLRAHIQVDPDLWAIFKRKNPDVYRLICSRDEGERMRGVRQLHILHPAWVTYARY